MTFKKEISDGVIINLLQRNLCQDPLTENVFLRIAKEIVPNIQIAHPDDLSAGNNNSGSNNSNNLSYDFKKGLKSHSIDDYFNVLSNENDDLIESWKLNKETIDPKRLLILEKFSTQYSPIVYKVFGHFDLAFLQSVEGMEVTSTLLSLGGSGATHSYFGTRTAPINFNSESSKYFNALTPFTPLLPYICISNLCVNPIFQFIFGKDLHVLLNIHFKDDLFQKDKIIQLFQ